MPGETGWSAAQRRLHWAVALLVALAFPLGWLMVAVPLDDLLAKFVLYQAHKTIGLTVLALLLVRLAVRARRGRPGWDDLPLSQRRAAAAAHGLLLALLAAVPALGYLAAATAPAQVPTLFLGVLPVPHLLGASQEWFPPLRQAHRALAIALVGLAALHAGAAVRHHLNGRPTLRRMWRATPAGGQDLPRSQST